MTRAQEYVTVQTPSGVFARRSFLVEAPAPAKSVRCAWRNFPSVAELIRLSTTEPMWVQKVDCLCLAANEIQARKHECSCHFLYASIRNDKEVQAMPNDACLERLARVLSWMVNAARAHV
ncbi:hypothetical protein IFM47457_06965 [Aspergillus lentulus]|nr:hypothetical protein IFM47457_06965 [Aspergillus lentulus]